MKKITVFLLLTLALIMIFSSCKKTYPTDVWDGTIAQSFEGGDGTKDSPYQITKASQFAYLAKSVNEGASYADKYISLLCDIDLNNKEWTPIGNGKYPFSGTFDGKGHSIKNLKILDAGKHKFTEDSTKSTWGYAGIFGLCENVSLCNLEISGASIQIENVAEYNQLYIGTLVGRLVSTSKTNVSNIKINNCSITNGNSKTSTTASGLSAMHIGGLIGYCKNDVSSESIVNKVQCEVSILYGENVRLSNCIGGIIGNVYNCNTFECYDFVSNLTTESPLYPSNNYYIGALGYIANMDGNTDLQNGFSKLTIDKKTEWTHGEVCVQEWNAVVGYIFKNKYSEVTDTVEYKFENLFGFIEQTDNTTNEVQILKQLYDIPNNVVCTENNCKPSESLPDSHGFDETVWNLSDLSNPKLK